MIDPALDPLRAALGVLMERDLHALPDPVLIVSTEELLTARAQLDGLITCALQVIDTRQATVAESGRQTRSWLIETQHLGEEDASRYLTVARLLPYRPALGAALRAGLITTDHARVIATALRKLPEPIKDTFVKEMLIAAESCDPSELARFSRELRDRLGGEETAMAAAQRRYDSRWVTVSPTFRGMHAVSGMLDPASAATVKAVLAPLLERAGPDDQRTAGQRCADALVTIAEHAMAAGGLPETGGEKPQVIATIAYTDLIAQIDAVQPGRATLNGIPITPTARG